MKTFTAIAALGAIASVNAWDPEFMRGAQTGMFLTSEDQFEDYSCPPAKVAQKIQAYIDMAQPMKMMMQNMHNSQNGGPNAKPSPMVTYADIAMEAAMSMGKISSLFDEMYDGGEFCKGLLFAREASYIVFKIGTKVMNNGTVDKKVGKEEKMALEHKFLQ